MLSQLLLPSDQLEHHLAHVDTQCVIMLRVQGAQELLLHDYFRSAAAFAQEDALRQDHQPSSIDASVREKHPVVRYNQPRVTHEQTNL